MSANNHLVVGLGDVIMPSGSAVFDRSGKHDLTGKSLTVDGIGPDFLTAADADGNVFHVPTIVQATDKSGAPVAICEASTLDHVL